MHNKLLKFFYRKRFIVKREKEENKTPLAARIELESDLDWYKWRLILEGVCTLEEYETYYDVEDVLDAHEALNIRESLEEERRNRDQVQRGY